MNFRYFIVFQFNGKNYHGWQLQPDLPTVQAELNEKLGLLLKTPIETVGAGRTDTGVHANYFVAHFDSAFDLSSKLDVLSSKLNHFLSRDISIFKIVPVPSQAHARFDAISRTYKYYISLKKDVFNTEYSWHMFCNLNIELMNEGATMLMDYDDFTSFSKLHSDVKTHICKITSAKWEQKEHQLVFTITADRFLRNMVRAIVGTLIYLGRNKINLSQFREIVESKNRSMAGESVPAHGLFLYHIKYPYPL
jgi:tRNA pseudouridine38-40 synthase